MTKPRKFTFELTLETLIEGKRTLRDWASVVGVPDARWGEVGHVALVLRPGFEIGHAEITAHLEPALKDAKPEECFQFERHGYFVVDLKDSRPGAPVFNRAVTLRDSWGKQGG